MQLSLKKFTLRNIFTLIGIIMVLPLRLILLILSPIILIRLGFIDGTRLGPLAISLDFYLHVANKEKFSKRRFDLFILSKPICNEYLKFMWSKSVTIFSKIWFWKMIEKSYQLLPFGNRNIINIYDFTFPNYNILSKTKPHPNFSKKEQIRGNNLLEQLGVKLGSRWICIHNRDSKYLSNLSENKNYDFSGNFDYHSYRDFSIHTMSNAAEELTKKGFYVIRSGSIQKENIKSDNPMIIDYAFSKFKSDFGDIFLVRNCEAFIGGDSGIGDLALLFRTPLFYINFSLTLLNIFPLRYTFYPYPFITKHLFDLKKKRNLSLREMFEMGLFQADKTNQFKEAGVEVVSNTPEEICDLTKEAIQKLNGDYRQDKNDESIQKEFWSIFFKYSEFKKDIDVPRPICSSFLNKNQYLLN